MQYGAGYMTPSGVRFVSDHPYQLVNDNEVAELLIEGRFKVATKEDLKEFYNIREDLNV
jgi:hypothetical protein